VTPISGVPEVEPLMNFLAFLTEHFWHAAPVLLAGLIGVTIVMERARALFVAYPMRDSRAFFEQISDLVLKGRMQEATALCERQKDKPVAQIAKAGLARAHLPVEAAEGGIQLALSELAQQVQKRTGYLATIANVATLLGLFGTISGLIFSFDAVGQADPQQKSALLSAGISTAMNATMLGLGVAIPCMVAFAILVSKANRIMGDMEDAAARTADILKLRFYAGDLEAARPETSNGHAARPEAPTLRRVA